MGKACPRIAYMTSHFCGRWAFRPQVGGGGDGLTPIHLLVLLDSTVDIQHDLDWLATFLEAYS